MALEYAEVLLQAEQPQAALELLLPLIARDSAQKPKNSAKDGRMIHGLAKAYLALGQYPQALEQFNLLYQNSRENTDLWWQAFLGEIRCRRALDQKPEILYNLISQKRVFFPEMGGAELKEEFGRLQAEFSPRK